MLGVLTNSETGGRRVCGVYTTYKGCIGKHIHGVYLRVSLGRHIYPPGCLLGCIIPTRVPLRVVYASFLAPEGGICLLPSP